MTPAQASQIVTNTIIDNTVGEITPAVMRTALLAIISMVGSQVGTGPSLAAVLIALEQMIPGGTATLISARPPDPSNPINVCFDHAPTVSTGGIVYNFIASTFPALNMTQLISNANTIVI